MARRASLSWSHNLLIALCSGAGGRGGGGRFGGRGGGRDGGGRGRGDFKPKMRIDAGSAGTGQNKKQTFDD